MNFLKPNNNINNNYNYKNNGIIHYTIYNNNNTLLDTAPAARIKCMHNIIIRIVYIRS